MGISLETPKNWVEFSLDLIPWTIHQPSSHSPTKKRVIPQDDSAEAPSASQVLSLPRSSCFSSSRTLRCGSRSRVPESSVQLRAGSISSAMLSLLGIVFLRLEPAGGGRFSIWRSQRWASHMALCLRCSLDRAYRLDLLAVSLFFITGCSTSSRLLA